MKIMNRSNLRQIVRDLFEVTQDVHSDRRKRRRIRPTGLTEILSIDCICVKIECLSEIL
jgi:hypothetical protein